MGPSQLYGGALLLLLCNSNYTHDTPSIWVLNTDGKASAMGWAIYDGRRKEESLV